MMKKLGLILVASLFMLSCGNEANSDCKEKCKKENCEHGSEKCKKECKKKCEENKDSQDCDKNCKKKCCAHEQGIMKLGTQNPSLEAKLMDISGKEMHIEELGKENGTLIIFSCNTCPYVVGRGEKTEGWENRYNDIKTLADASKIGFALVNSNEGKRDKDDSFEAMKSHAADNEYGDMYYLMDKNHIVADAFGAKTTPHVFLFDNQNKLVYTGAIDDNVDRKAEVKEQWLNNAMTALAAGNPIEMAETKNMGCSIKRVKKEEGH